MTLPRYAVLLVGSPARRQWLRQLLAPGAMVAESEVGGAAARLNALRFDLVLCDTSDSAEPVAAEQSLAWNRDYADVPRFYFVARGTVAPPPSRRVFVLEQPVSEQMIRASLTRLLQGKEIAHLVQPVTVSAA